MEGIAHQRCGFNLGPVQFFLILKHIPILFDFIKVRRITHFHVQNIFVFPQTQKSQAYNCLPGEVLRIGYTLRGSLGEEDNA